MPIDPRDAPPGYRAAPSDGNCRCTATLVRCAFHERGGCRIPQAFKRADPNSWARKEPCYDFVRKDGVLAMFLEGEEPYGNEED